MLKNFVIALMLASFCLNVGCQKKEDEATVAEGQSNEPKVKNKSNNKNSTRKKVNKKNKNRNTKKKMNQKKKNDQKPVKLVEVPPQMATKILRPFEKVEFTAEQQEANKTFMMEHGEEFRLLRRKMNEIVAPENRKPRSEAAKAARAAGKSDAEIEAAMQAAFELDAETLKKVADVQTEEEATIKKVRGKIRRAMTDEQKAILPPPKNKKS